MVLELLEKLNAAMKKAVEKFSVQESMLYKPINNLSLTLMLYEEK